MENGFGRWPYMGLPVGTGGESFSVSLSSIWRTPQGPHNARFKLVEMSDPMAKFDSIRPNSDAEVRPVLERLLH